MKTIDRLTPGSEVTIEFQGSKSLGNEPYTLDLEFVGIIDNANGWDNRRATFRDGNYTFDLYRYNGRWAYGSSAEPARLLDIISEPEVRA